LFVVKSALSKHWHVGQLAAERLNEIRAAAGVEQRLRQRTPPG